MIYKTGDIVRLVPSASDVFVNCLAKIIGSGNSMSFPILLRLLSPAKDGYSGELNSKLEHIVPHQATKLEKIIWNIK